MLIDSDLLPHYQSALNNDPEAILKIADAYRFGIGAPKNVEIANRWYEKLLQFNNLPFVKYEYCYFIAGDAAYDRQDYKLAYERYNNSLRLFVQQYGAKTAFEKMNEFEFFNAYYQAKVLVEANC